MIRVEVINHDQPNSRWYSGTGIYRPVWLYTVPKNHLRFDSVKITTLDYKGRRSAWRHGECCRRGESGDSGETDCYQKSCGWRKCRPDRRTIEPCIDENAVQPTVQNSDKASDKIIALEILQADGKFSENCSSGSKPLEPEAPNLYTCRVTFGEDIQEETWNPCSKLYSGRGLLYQRKTMSC